MKILFPCTFFYLLSGLDAVLMGMVTSDTVLLSSTSDFAPNKVRMKDDFDMMENFGNTMLVAFQGDPTICTIVCDYLKRSCDEYYLNSKKKLSCASIAHLCQNVIAEHLLGSNINLLIAGIESGKPRLYTVDNVGAKKYVPFAVFGSDFPFVFSYLDRELAGRGSKILNLKEGR